jgi:hypothetical protein
MNGRNRSREFLAHLQASNGQQVRFSARCPFFQPAEKVAALKAANIEVADSPADMGLAVQRAMQRRRRN